MQLPLAVLVVVVTTTTALAVVRTIAAAATLAAARKRSQIQKGSRSYLDADISVNNTTTSLLRHPLLSLAGMAITGTTVSNSSHLPLRVSTNKEDQGDLQ